MDISKRSLMRRDKNRKYRQDNLYFLLKKNTLDKLHYSWYCISTKKCHGGYHIMFRKGKYIESTSGVIGLITKCKKNKIFYQVVYPQYLYGLTCRIYDKRFYKIIG